MKEKALCLSEFVLKVVAIITMTLDHLGIFLNAYFAEGSAAYLTGNVFRILGRIAFPLFAFMLAEGCAIAITARNTCCVWRGCSLAC